MHSFLECSLHLRDDESKKGDPVSPRPISLFLWFDSVILTLDGPREQAEGGSSGWLGFFPLEGSAGPEKRESCLELPGPPRTANDETLSQRTAFLLSHLPSLPSIYINVFFRVEIGRLKFLPLRRNILHHTCMNKT